MAASLAVGTDLLLGELLVLAGHVVLFLIVLRLAHVSYRAYRAAGDELQRTLAVAFLLMTVGISGDDFTREVLGVERIPTEAIELVPLLLAFGLIYAGLFLGDDA